MNEFRIISMKLNEHTTNKYSIGEFVIIPYPIKTYEVEGYIYATRISDKGESVEDRIQIIDKDILDKYYKELYERFKEWSE